MKHITKDTEKQEVGVSSEPPVKRMVVTFPRPLWRELKLRAIDLDMPLYKMINQCIRVGLDHSVNLPSEQ